MYGVVKYIDENIEEKLTLEEIAEFAGYSKWHFCSLFRRFTGQSFVDYVNDRKMQYAAVDILGGEMVTDVAFKYGFDTCGGFNKAFLRKFGCYPTQFRKADTEFHIQYKERIKKMYQLSDRCAILREDAVNKKTMLYKAGHTARLYGAMGEATCEKGADNAQIRTAGLCSIIENFRPYILDGELIVGYNYGWETAFVVDDTPEKREELRGEGFSETEIDGFFKNIRKDVYNYANVEYDEFDELTQKEKVVIAYPLVSDHNVLDYESVLQLGFTGLLEKVEKYEEANGESSLYTAAKRICEAACAMGEKYAKEAARLAETETLPERKAELLKIKETCLQVPRYPARNFMEAVQSLWFAHIITTWEDKCVNANSLGRLDQILYPYYQKDIESGVLTNEEAFELICCLWIKLYRDYDVQQSCVGGVTRDGKDAVNELSYMMLDATERLDFVRCLSVRYGKDTDSAFMKRALEVVGHMQKGVPFFFNDDVMIPALTDAGITIEDARDYTQIGCVETVIPGKSNPHAVVGRANFLKAIEFALNDGKSMISDFKLLGVNHQPTRSIQNYEVLKQIVFSYVENMLDFTCKRVVAEISAHEHIACRPYKSLLTEGCIENNKDFNNHGALYDYYQIMFCGVPNLADSLIAVKKLVFEEGKYTLDELVYQLKNDYPDERVRLDFLNNAPKFGNDVDEVDLLAAELINFGCDVLQKCTEKYGYSFHAQPFTYLWLIEHGQMTAATPDGRRKGENIAYSVSPMQGRDFNGLTAVFNSITKLPAYRTPGTTSAIVEVDPHLFTDRNLDTLTQMMLALAEKGLSNVQFNITDAKTLIDAKKHPQKYPNLAVRVSGFSQKFYLLDSDLQDHIIARTKHKCL